MRFTRSLVVSAILLSHLAPAARAHAPGESSLVIARDEEALELRLSISLASAAVLLGPELDPPLGTDTFDRHRPALLAAASQGLHLRDADGATLKPERIIATFRNEHEVRLDFFFPPASRPASLGLPLLGRMGREVWCDVADLRVDPPFRALMRPPSPEILIAP